MTTPRRGTITTWKDDRGFGFITPDDGGSPVFFHISSLVQRQPRPVEQVEVVYTLTQDEHQRARAINVRFVTSVTKDARPEPLITVIVVSLFFLLLLFGTWIIPLTPWILVLYGISSGITYKLYALDKVWAQQQTERIPENVLHLLELVGGWPGALLAQEYQRHKTVKASYQRMFWFMVSCNLVLLIGYSTFLLLTQR